MNARTSKVMVGNSGGQTIANSGKCTACIKKGGFTGGFKCKRCDGQSKKLIFLRA